MCPNSGDTTLTLLETIVPFRKHLVKLESQLTESYRDGRHTELVFCHSLNSLERGRERKPWEASHIHVLCYTDSFATVLYAIVLPDFTGVNHLSMMRAESAYLCLGRPPLGV